MRPALQGVLVHNYIFEMWADMGYLALGAGIDVNIKARVRPDFYFDGVIRDIKPLPFGKTPADVVVQYRDQFKKYVETAYELNGRAYYPTMELIFYQLDPVRRAIVISDQPYRVDLKELGIEASGKIRANLLNELSNFLETIGPLQAVVYDKNRQHVLLFGKVSRPVGLKPNDFLVAARAVFSTEDHGAMVSIDPDPENLETCGLVRYGGDIEGTNVGHVLFESDLMLKCLGQGYDIHKDQPVSSKVDGYRPMMDLISEQEAFDQAKEQWIRFWFTPEEAEIASTEEYSVIVFPDNFMTVKTENMKFDGKKLVSDFTPDPSSAQGRFAAHFNAHLEAFTNEWPVFRQLQEIGKLVALFRWFFEQGINLDLAYLKDADLQKFPYPTLTPLIESKRSFVRERSVKDLIITKKVELRMIGGVDLQHFNFKQVSATKYDELVAAIQQHPDHVPFQYGDAMGKRLFLTTVAIPNMNVRQAIYQNCYELIPPEVRDRIKLRMDAYGRVMVYTDSENHTYYFEYDDMGRLSSVRGWDQPIHYEFRDEDGQISFCYKMFSDTNEYLKRFEYAPGSDQVQRVEIYKNNERQHAFSVRVLNKDVIVERQCQ